MKKKLIKAICAALLAVSISLSFSGCKPKKNNMLPGEIKTNSDVYDSFGRDTTPTPDADPPEQTTDFARGAKIKTDSQNPAYPVTNAVSSGNTENDETRWGTFPDLKTKDVTAEIIFNETALISYVNLSQFMGAGAGWPDGDRLSNVKIELADNGEAYTLVADGEPVERSSEKYCLSRVIKLLDKPMRAARMRVTLTMNSTGLKQGLNIKCINAFGVKADEVEVKSQDFVDTLNAANSRKASKYDYDSWQKFEPIRNEARLTFKKEQVTQEEIANANQKLVDAVYELVSVNTHKGKIKVAFAGESVSAGYKLKTPAKEAYSAAILDELGIANYESANFSSTSQDIAYISTSEYKRSLEFAPDVVVIMMDAKTSQTTDETKFKSENTSLINSYKLQESNPTIFFCSAPTALKGVDNAVSSEERAKIAALQKEIASQSKVNFIDIKENTKDFSTDMFIENSAVYLNAQGHQKIAKNVADAFKQARGTVCLSQLVFLEQLADMDQSLFVPKIWDKYDIAKKELQFILSNKSATVEQITKAREKLNKAYEKLSDGLDPKMTRVACVGDSITYGGGNKTSSYPAILQTKFDQSGKKGKFTVKNYGVDGLMASPRQGCGLTSHENYIKSKAFLPNIVVIMLGTNDAKYIGENSPLYKDDMKSIIKAFQDLPSKPKIYIATSPRAHDVGNKGPGRDWASAINEKIVPLQRELAKELDLPLIDVNEYTKDMKAKVSDGIHGPYPDIAECIFKGISE